MKHCYVVIRREPHGEVVDTLVMGATRTTADAEEYILGMAEDYGYLSFCMALDLEENVTFEEAQEFGQKATDSFIHNCNILATYYIEEE